jgi:Mn-dependent DtxR family transcriptional regulator
MMNLAQTERLLCGQTQDYLKTVYRQSKITGSVQINFIAAKLGMTSAAAAGTAQLLQQSGMILYEKYGRIRLTDDGKRYVNALLAYDNGANP